MDESKQSPLNTSKMSNGSQTFTQARNKRDQDLIEHFNHQYQSDVGGFRQKVQRICKDIGIKPQELNLYNLQDVEKQLIDFAEKGKDPAVQEARYDFFKKKKLKAIQLIYKYVTPPSPAPLIIPKLHQTYNGMSSNYGFQSTTTMITSQQVNPYDSPLKSNNVNIGRNRGGIGIGGSMSNRISSFENSIALNQNKYVNSQISANTGTKFKNRRVSFNSARSPFMNFTKLTRNVQDSSHLFNQSQQLDSSRLDQQRSMFKPPSQILRNSTSKSRLLDRSTLVVNKDPIIAPKVPLTFRMPEKVKLLKNNSTLKQVKVKTNLQVQAQELINNFETKLMKQEKKVDQFQKYQKQSMHSRIQSADKRNEKFQTISKKRNSQQESLERSSLVRFHQNLTENSQKFQSQREQSRKKAIEDFERFRKSQNEREQALLSQRSKHKEIQHKVQLDLEQVKTRIQTSIQIIIVGPQHKIIFMYQYFRCTKYGESLTIFQRVIQFTQWL